MVWLIVVTLLFSGCSRSVSEPVVPLESVNQPTMQTVTEASVQLQDVTFPVWDDVFVVMETGGQLYPVNWGISEDGCWLTESSGFPGFDYPMLIVGTELDLSEEVFLQTEYGSWEYQLEEEEEAVFDRNVENAISLRDEEGVVNFNQGLEVLYIMDLDSSEIYSYQKVGGTVITR